MTLVYKSSVIVILIMRKVLDQPNKWINGWVSSITNIRRLELCISVAFDIKMLFKKLNTRRKNTRATCSRAEQDKALLWQGSERLCSLVEDCAPVGPFPCRPHPPCWGKSAACRRMSHSASPRCWVFACTGPVPWDQKTRRSSPPVALVVKKHTHTHRIVYTTAVNQTTHE